MTLYMRICYVYIKYIHTLAVSMSVYVSRLFFAYMEANPLPRCPSLATFCSPCSPGFVWISHHGHAEVEQPIGVESCGAMSAMIAMVGAAITTTTASFC